MKGIFISRSKHVTVEKHTCIIIMWKIINVYQSEMLDLMKNPSTFIILGFFFFQ